MNYAHVTAQLAATQLTLLTKQEKLLLNKLNC
jgi:hypothetical protein